MEKFSEIAQEIGRCGISERMVGERKVSQDEIYKKKQDAMKYKQIDKLCGK